MSATTFVRMPSAKQMAMMGIPDLPEAAFGGDIPPMQRKALVKAMGIRPQKGGGLTAVVAVVAAVAIPFVAPAIAASIGVSGAIAGAAASAGISAATAATVGSVVGSAIVGAGLGAVSAAVTGGDVGRGALMGGLGSGISGYFAAPQVAPTAGGVPTSTVTSAPGTTTVGIANLGDGTAAVATFDPATKTYMLANGTAVDPSAIAYGGQVNSSLANTLSSTNNLQGAADAIQASGTLSVNTPVALGGNAANLGTTSYYNAGAPVVNAGTVVPEYAVQSAPVYAQSGQAVSAAAERTAAATAAFDPLYASNVAPASATTTTAGGTTTSGGGTTTAGGAGGPAQAAPATLSEALKQKLTNPSNQADLVLRAAGQLVGSAIAGDGLSDEEKALVAQQKAELESLRSTNKALFDQKIQQALEYAGESRYFDPETFGLRASRQVQNAGARAKQEGLRGIDSRRAGLRRAEERRYNLGIDTGAQTAYLQGMDMAEQNKLRVKQAGLSAIPSQGYEASNMQYASYLGNMYDAADRRRRAAAGDIGDLFGGFTGGAKSSGTTIKIG